MLLCFGVALLLSGRRTPIYESQADVLVTPIDFGTAEIAVEIPNLETEVQLVSSVAVAEIVATELQIAGAPSELLKNLHVVRPADTEILEISYRDADPDRAQRIAEGFAESYLVFRQETATETILRSAKRIEDELAVLGQRLERIDRDLALLPRNDPRRGSLEVEAELLQGLILERQLERLSLPTQVTVGRIIEPASLPSSPASPNHVVAGALGLITGVALGLGIAFLRDRLSGRLRSADEAEVYLGAPVLGAIPRVPEWRRKKRPHLVTLGRRGSPAAEAYRVLRTNVLSTAPGNAATTIVVTSAHADEGKTATVANLGVVLASAGKVVTLVSADLRRPRLHEFFSRDGQYGLADVLAGRMPLDRVTQGVTLPSSGSADPSGVTLQLVPSGRVPDDPAELLASETMRTVLRNLEERSDFVLIDVPPILAVTDALVVAQLVRGVLVVIGPQSLDRSIVLSTRQQLDKVGAHILGGVLNGPTPRMGRADYY